MRRRIEKDEVLSKHRKINQEYSEPIYTICENVNEYIMRAVRYTQLQKFNMREEKEEENITYYAVIQY